MELFPAASWYKSGATRRSIPWACACSSAFSAILGSHDDAKKISSSNCLRACWNVLPRVPTTSPVLREEPGGSIKSLKV